MYTATHSVINSTDTVPKTMKRAIFRHFGGPNVLEIQEAPVPKLKNGQVLVKNLATSINGGDLNVRKGFKNKLIVAMAGFPRTTGLDIVGKVVRVSKTQTDFQVGDLVWGNASTSTNACAEYVAITPKKLSLMPTRLSPIEAGTIPAAGVTALVSIVDKGQLKAGEKVLIRGVGGVGFFAAQIAKAIGANVTVLGSKTAAAEMKQYGADSAFNYHDTKIEDLGAYDLIFDTVGTNLQDFRTHLNKNGRLVTIAFVVSEMFKLVTSLRFGKHRSRLVIAFPNRDNLTRLAELVDSGAVVPKIDSVFPIDEITKAHARAEQHGVFGKIAIDIAGGR